jgi:thioredoxin reductase
MTFDTLIIGGGAAGLSCALVLGSAQNKPFTTEKYIGIVTHQKTSHLQTALFNNVLGLKPGTLGADILDDGKAQLTALYPHIHQIAKEKVTAIEKHAAHYSITTNRNTYRIPKLLLKKIEFGLKTRTILLKADFMLQVL